MSSTPRRLRRGRRPGIPFVIKFTDVAIFTEDQADVVREKVRKSARRGDPLIVGKNVDIIDLRRRA